MSYGDNGRTTLDDTLEMCYHSNATPVFIPDLITDEEKASDAAGIRLRGHTAMRNMGIHMALQGGYDFVFLVENDAKCPSDTLERLMSHVQPIIVPRPTFPIEPIIASICYAPVQAPGTPGIINITWAVHTAVLFNCHAVRALLPRAFCELDGEGTDYRYWKNRGLRACMDLDAPIEILEIALGQRSIVEIPFRIHKCEAGTPGHVKLLREDKRYKVYGCSQRECGYRVVVPLERE